MCFVIVTDSFTQDILPVLEKTSTIVKPHLAVEYMFIREACTISIAFYRYTYLLI